MWVREGRRVAVGMGRAGTDRGCASRWGGCGSLRSEDLSRRRRLGLELDE